MNRLVWRTPEEQIAYHLADGRAVNFEESQGARVAKGRELLERALGALGRRAEIVELGCGAADISGPFSTTNTVWGVDIVPAAQVACQERWPDLHFLLGDVNAITAWDVDVVVLTEVLEHLSDPLGLVARWLPHARYSIIGHPIDDPGNVEGGHVWGYDRDDYLYWFELGAHEPLEVYEFSMGPFPEMIIGAGRHK